MSCLLKISRVSDHHKEKRMENRKNNHPNGQTKNFSPLKSTIGIDDRSMVSDKNVVKKDRNTSTYQSKTNNYALNP